MPLNIAGGVRVGPGAAFLEPALGRPNLTVLTDTRATRVRIAAGRAVGVDLTGPDGPGRLDAHRVVLSAGALESAHLLMLSGVGPAGALAALGIRVLADLPVGVRCRDHPEWLLPTGWAPSPGHPVLEAVLVTEPWRSGRTPPAGAGTTSIGVALMRPGSRGRVSLVSADPAVPPSIEHRYDGDPADGAALREGCESVAEVLGGVTELGEPSWSTSQHLCGTAPMGTGEDAVVDPVGVVCSAWTACGGGAWYCRASGPGPHATVAMLGHRARGVHPGLTLPRERAGGAHWSGVSACRHAPRAQSGQGDPDRQVLEPPTNVVAICSGLPASSMLLIRGMSSEKKLFISIRASAAPGRSAPVAEGQVLVRVAADVEAHRVGEDVLVAVGRDVAQQHGLALGDRNPRTSVSACAVRMNS